MLMHVLVGAAAAAVFAWLYLLLAHGDYWRIRRQFPPAAPSSPCHPPVVAIIPARNEREGIGRSLASLLATSGVGPMPVFVVDDASNDGTAEVARNAAHAACRDDLLTVVPGAPLPAGWTGKLWAVQQGIERAAGLNPRFFLLTDADIVHAPEDLLALIELAEADQYDLASLMVRLHCRSLPEKLLIPAFVHFFFQLYPPKWIANPARNAAGAAGGCMVIRPEALRRAGGVEAIRGHVIDDCALAGRVKDSGGRVWLGPARSSYSLRESDSFTEIGRMISRTAFHQLRHSAPLLALVVMGLCWIYLLPLALLLTGRPLLMALGGTAWLLMTATYWPMVRYYRCAPGWAFSLPLAAAFYAGATFHSAIKYWQGHGGQWKGRVQDPS